MERVLTINITLPFAQTSCESCQKIYARLLWLGVFFPHVRTPCRSLSLLESSWTSVYSFIARWTSCASCFSSMPRGSLGYSWNFVSACISDLSFEPGPNLACCFGYDCETSLSVSCYERLSRALASRVRFKSHRRVVGPRHFVAEVALLYCSSSDAENNN